MMRRQSHAGPVRRGATLLRTGVAAGALILGLGACESVMEVENPNNVKQEDVETPQAARALVNGTLARAADAISRTQLAQGTMSDEWMWRGSFNAMNQLDLGIVRDNSNQYTAEAYNRMVAARWLAEESITQLEKHAAANALTDRRLLAQAYLHSAVLHATLGDMYEDVTFSNRMEAGPPIGETNMHRMYDMAVERLDKAITISQAANDPATELAALAFRARAKWAKALWGKLNPRANTADPLIDDAGANADATAALARLARDYRYRLTFSSASQQSEMAFNANSRLEIAIADEYVKQDASGRLSCTALNANCREDGTRLMDPINNVKDPALRDLTVEFIQGGVYSAITVVSARELYLILAEGALKRGDMTAFTTNINAVRALSTGLTPYSAATHASVSPLALLRHTRRVNLFGYVQRRLADMYRFGERSPHWIDSGDAVTKPGAVFLISREEAQSNCYILGSC